MSCQNSNNLATHEHNIQSKVLAALAEGATITDAARQTGIPRATIYNWVATVPELAAYLETAAKIRTLAFWDQIFELAETAVDTLRHFVIAEDTAPNHRLRAALALTRLIQSHQPKEPPSRKEEDRRPRLHLVSPPEHHAGLPEQGPKCDTEPDPAPPQAPGPEPKVGLDSEPESPAAPLPAQLPPAPSNPPQPQKFYLVRLADLL